MDFGLEIIFWLQSLGAWIVPVMGFFSFLGNEEFYLLVLPIIFWSVNLEVGLNIGILLMLSGSLNSIAKITVHSPRPFWVHDTVRALSSETSFGIPSGHSQNAATIWGYAGTVLPRPWGMAAMLVLIGLVGISRLALGMHYLSDVLSGWLLGAVTVWLYLRWAPAVKNWLLRQTWQMRIVWILLFSVGLAGLGWATQTITQANWTFPEAWFSRATAVAVDEPFEPFSLDGLLSTSGALFGLGAGAVLLFEFHQGMNTGGTLWQRALRYIIGLVGVLILWRGLGAILPRDADLLSAALRFTRYALIGGWVTYLAPRLFVATRLVEPKQTPANLP